MGSAAATAEKNKHTKYQTLEPNYIFCPIAIESSGVFGEEGLSLIKKIGEKIMKITGESKSTSYLIQRISLAVQRGNAASILGSVPSANNLEEVFYL